jgi:Fur family zinc uptake transcriptional regulator
MTKKDENTLSSHGQRVLDLLLAAKKPMTAYAILDKVRRFGLKAPTTIYRALGELQERGLVHKIESLNAFVACQHADEAALAAHESSFAICTSCGAVEEIEDPSLTRLIGKVGHHFLADIRKNVLELAGVCHACCEGKKSGPCSH